MSGTAVTVHFVSSASSWFVAPALWVTHGAEPFCVEPRATCVIGGDELGNTRVFSVEERAEREFLDRLVHLCDTIEEKLVSSFYFCS